ncbi:hypothetical protein [Bacillus cereus group sp. BfR-BA-01326]|uniref:hypothetical protein n=1 Tax=Bacillus cereus group sp. BfR-BA-01326 TaxID=2920302 RepID=UPI001F58A033|nr:hypothetical protein [Bacillus cereus group sp. BfR-BA-01326]
MKIMNIQKTIENIETLKLAKLANKEIEKILELEISVEEIYKQYEEEQKLKTIDEIVELFNKELKEKNKEWNYHKVFRLIKSEKLGSIIVKGKHKINVDVAEDFIKESKKTKEDYKEECEALKKQIEVLQKKIKTLEAKQNKDTTPTGRKRTVKEEPKK